MIPTCKQTSALLSQGQDRPLALPEKIGMYAHLLVCRGCRGFSRQLDFMREALRRYRDRA